MTTGAMVLGALPLAISEGAGAENRQQIGWVIVGGMTVGTVLTLFVVPAVYSYLGRRNLTKPEAAEDMTAGFVREV
jgi:multidrug efflux pump